MLFIYKARQDKFDSIKGVTLLECVVALSVMMIVLLLLMDALQLATRTSEKDFVSSELTWHLFLIQLANTSDKWELVKVEPERLVFRDLNEAGMDNRLSIEKYHSQIKKQKRGGYDALLLGVSQVKFFEGSKGVVLNVEMKDGKSYQALFPFWQKKERAEDRK